MKTGGNLWNLVVVEIEKKGTLQRNGSVSKYADDDDDDDGDNDDATVD